MPDATFSPVTATSLAESIGRVLRQSEEPLTLAALQKALGGPRQQTLDQLEQFAADAIRSGQLFRFAPYGGKQPRFWDRDAQAYARDSIRRALKGGPLSQTALDKAIAKRLADQSQADRKAILHALVQEGGVCQLPPMQGGRTVRYSLEPPDPREYVRRPVSDFRKRLEAIGKKLKPFGISPDQTLATALEMLREAEQAAPAEPIAPATIATTATPRPATTPAGVLMERMIELDPAARQGGVVSIRQLRNAVKDVLPTKEAFDDALLELAARNTLILYRHDWPASLPEEERAAMVHDGHGNYYLGVSTRR